MELIDIQYLQLLNLGTFLTGTCDWAEEWGWHMAKTSIPSQVSKYHVEGKIRMNIESWHWSLRSSSRASLKHFMLCFMLLTRSSTTPSRNFTTSPKLSSNSNASISSTVTNGDSSCSPGYTLNNSTSSGNRRELLSDLFLHDSCSAVPISCALIQYFR